MSASLCRPDYLSIYLSASNLQLPEETQQQLKVYNHIGKPWNKIKQNFFIAFVSSSFDTGLPT